MVGGVSRHNEEKHPPSRFTCRMFWDLADRFARVEPFQGNRKLSVEKLYAVTVDDLGTEDEWWEISPWKIHWKAEKGEGQIIFDKEMTELLDPEDPEYYWRNHVRRTTVTTADEIIYYFSQPDPKKKGKFLPFGKLKGIREEMKHYSYPTRQMVIDLHTGTPLEKLEWIFSGSLIDKGKDFYTGREETFYVADRTGVVMQLIPDRLAVLDNPEHLDPLQNELMTSYATNVKICPPVGTKVTLEFTLVRETKKTKEVR
jgi:hypothetical protein